MSCSIAILGATGAVGSALSAHILSSGILEPHDTLQLVGHNEVACTGRLLAIRADLLDAFDDQSVRVDVIPEISEAKADLVIVASDVPMPPGMMDRRDMARANLPFASLAALSDDGLVGRRRNVVIRIRQRKKVLCNLLLITTSSIPTAHILPSP